MVSRLRRFLRSRWAKLAVCVFSLFVAVLIAEVVFRVFGIRGHYESARVDMVFPGPDGTSRRVAYGFISNATIISRYSSNPRGYFLARNGIEHKLNSVGWRDEERTLKKPANTFRIFGLGDSYLYGQGVKSQDICLSRLGNQLQKQYPRVGFECINSGMSGYNTVQQRNLLRDRGLAYDPDLVILHFVLNDVEPNVYRPGVKIEFFREYTSIYQTSDTLSRYSYLWSWSRQRYLRTVQARKYVHQCVTSFSPDSSKWRQCREALNDIQSLCRSKGVQLLVVIFPFFVDLDRSYPFAGIHDVVREHCKTQGIHVLDLYPEYAGYRGPELWVHSTDQHPNEEAHKIAADAMAQYLKKHATEFHLRK